MLPRKFYYIGATAAEGSQTCIRQQEVRTKCFLTDRSENECLVKELNTYFLLSLVRIDEVAAE